VGYVVIDRSIDLLPPSLPPHTPAIGPVLLAVTHAWFYHLVARLSTIVEDEDGKGRCGFQTSGLYIATVH